MTERRTIGARGRAVSALALFFLAVGLTGWARAAEVRVTTVETFDTGHNEGEWIWGTGSETFIDSETAAGRYLREDYLVTFTPKASTSFGVQSAFTGDYRARNVSSVGIDMAIASVNYDVTNRTVTLILLNDNDTPEDLSDDWGAYTVTEHPIPPTGVAGILSETDMLQWASYDIPVPSQSRTLPDGWTWVSSNTARPNGPWSRLMRDVDHVGFIMGDPALRYPLYLWDVAMNNPRITTVGEQ